MLYFLIYLLKYFFSNFLNIIKNNFLHLFEFFDKLYLIINIQLYILFLHFDIFTNVYTINLESGIAIINI